METPPLKRHEQPLAVTTGFNQLVQLVETFHVLLIHLQLLQCHSGLFIHSKISLFTQL